MKQIPLTQGKVALVDDEDYPLVSQYKWCAFKSGNTFYASHEVREPGGRDIKWLMHRLLMGLNGPDVDHRNGDGLDNRRDNLRYATDAQNQGNSRKHKRGTSQYKGVSWDKHNQRWRAYITKAEGFVNLGRFKSEEEAARAYDRVAIEYFGEFANLNFPVVG